MSQANHSTGSVAMDSLSEETIGELLARRARSNPEDIYCSFRSERISVGLLDRRVNQVATLLKSQGLQKGDRVAVMLPSHPDHLYLLFALARLGMVRVPINVHLLGAPLAHLLHELAPQAIVADTALRAALDELGIALPHMIWRNGIDAEFDRFASCDEDNAAPLVKTDEIIASRTAVHSRLPSAMSRGDSGVAYIAWNVRCQFNPPMIGNVASNAADCMTVATSRPGARNWR